MSEHDNLKPFEDVIDLLEAKSSDHTLAKERIFKRLVNKIETGAIQPAMKEKDGIQLMRKSWKNAAVAAAAAVVLLGGAVTTTTYAQDMLQSILARFHVGNMDIVQVDQERPVPGYSASSEQVNGAESARAQLPAQPKLSLEAARTAIGMNFPAPTWMADYEYVNTVIHGKNMVEVQYKQGEKSVNFLISQGGTNGIETTEQVKTEVMEGTKVYFANGIVIWEHQGFTVELYAQEDFDSASLTKIIQGFAFGKALTQEQINHAKSNVDSLIRAERAAQAGPAPMEHK